MPRDAPVTRTTRSLKSSMCLSVRDGSGQAPEPGYRLPGLYRRRNQKEGCIAALPRSQPDRSISNRPPPAGQQADDEREDQRPDDRPENGEWLVADLNHERLWQLELAR